MAERTVLPAYANPDDPVMLQKHCERRMTDLEADRSSYWQHWQELSDFILPRRGRFLGQPNAGNKGSKRSQKIINSTGTLAARTLASGMQAGITSPARPWFRYGLEDSALQEYGPVKLWLTEAEKRMRRIFAKSNLYNSLHVLYEELGVFGTGVIVMLEDPQTVIRTQTLTVGEYYLASSDGMRCDVLYRKFPMTVAQMVRRFGEEKVSVNIRHLYTTGQYDKEFEVVHAIEPNPVHQPGKLGPKGKPFLSVYYDRSAAGQCLSIAGFDDLPFMAPRWHLAQNDVYGRSPGMDALPDVIALQVLEREKAKAIQKIGNPPMVADGKLKNEPASVLPGGVTFIPGGGGAAGAQFAPAYQINPNLSHWTAEIDRTEDRTNRAFFADLFLMISQMEGVQPRNQLEISKRDEEKLLQLGPVLERVHGELLDPIVDRGFNIALKRGLLPPIPDELRDHNIDIEYISTMAQAQKAVATTGIERLWAFAGSIAAVDPSVLDKLDVDQSIDEYADHLGVTPKVVRSDDDVAKVRQSRAAAQQAAQMAEMAQTGLAAAQAGKVLSETDVGGGQSALAMMTGL